MKNLRVIVILLCFFTASAQEPEKGRQQPASRPLDVKSQQQSAPLPVIDLPEFVITGTASINPPDVDKDTLDESGLYKRHPLEDIPQARDQETIDLGQRFKQSLFSTGIARDGMVTASMGTFFTPHLLGSYGVSASSYGFLTKAEYRRTKGFAQFTDASQAALSAEGSIVFHSPNEYFNEARLGADVSYEIRKYKFYGSARPSLQRDRSLFGFDLSASSAVGGPLPYHAGMTYRAMGLNDSTSEVTENHLTIRGGSQVPVFSVPVGVNLNVDLASVVGMVTSSFSLVHLDLRSPEWSWNDLMVRVILNGYAVKGMSGQSGSYFYPEIRISHRVTSTHVLLLGYHPSVRFSTLRELSGTYPYVSGNAVVRHAIDRLAISGGVESGWENDFTTKILFEYQQSTDIPLYTDTTGSGIGTLSYGGATTIGSVRLDGVANITPNDYFAVAVTARSSRNERTGARVPYLPAWEVSASHRHSFPFRLDVITRVSLYDTRRATAFSGQTVPGGLWSSVRGEYRGIPGLMLFVNVENLLDRSDEVWRGYRVEPFRADVGLSFRW